MNTNLIQSQIEIEKKFYRLHIEESLKNTWNELLVKLREDAESEPELNNYIPMLDKYEQSTMDKFIRKLRL